MSKNKLTTLFFLVSLFHGLGFSQSKKEQIELLQQRFDSLQVVQNKLIVSGTKTQKEFDTYKMLSVKRLDSLNTLRVSELKRNQSLSTQLNEANARNQKNDQEILELKRSLQESETAMMALTHRVDLLLDSVTMYKKALEKTVTVRDLSDGKFSKSELDFIIEYFKKEILNYSHDGLGAVMEINGEQIIVHLEGELGYVPAFHLEKKLPAWIAGDLDHDGTNEIIFDVFFTGGGTTYWIKIFCLKLNENSRYSLIEMDAPCPCTNKLECREPTANIQGFSNNLITINSQCFGSNDAMCCPSSNVKAKYKFLNNKLILMN
jgi:hypothetical protein